VYHRVRVERGEVWTLHATLAAPVAPAFSGPQCLLAAISKYDSKSTQTDDFDTKIYKKIYGEGHDPSPGPTMSASRPLQPLPALSDNSHPGVPAHKFIIGYIQTLSQALNHVLPSVTKTVDESCNYAIHNTNFNGTVFVDLTKANVDAFIR